MTIGKHVFKFFFMKWLVILVILSECSMAEDINQWHPITLANSQQINIYSDITKTTYNIRVFVPTEPPMENQQGYPVAFLLDGDVSFIYAQQAALRLLSRKVIAPVIIVAIDFANQSNHLSRTELRTKDYTPSMYEDSYFKNNKQLSGGADKFLAFIEQELKPWLAKKYPINSAKQALYGHSYGGLLVLHAFATSIASFQYYYAASPSIWWDNNYVLKEVEQRLQQLTNNPAQPKQTTPLILRASVGSLEQTADDTDMIRSKIIKERAMVDNLEQLAKVLKIMPSSVVDFSYQVLPDEDHGSVQAIAINRFIMDFSRLK